MIKVTCKQEFTWRHDAKEEYTFGAKPIEITEEAFDHVQKVFGSAMFSIVQEKAKEEVIKADVPKKSATKVKD